MSNTVLAMPSSDDDPSVFDLERFLPHQLSIVTNRVSATLERMYSRRYGINVTGWRILAVLGMRAPLSSRALSDEVAMDAVAISRAIEQLVRLGLVSRRSDPKDRRRHSLRLSAKGQKVHDEIVPVARGIERAVLDALAPEDREALVRIMKTLAERSTVILSDERDWREFLD
ncbi:MAG: MarR family transcriptional regulator [Alphaproteobacteria bacterium]|nr:MarR family transcriptional regulator [Alphaproteobacteria bacterium]